MEDLLDVKLHESLSMCLGVRQEPDQEDLCGRVYSLYVNFKALSSHGGFNQGVALLDLPSGKITLKTRVTN